MCDDVLPTWIFQENGSYHPRSDSGTNQLNVNKSTCWTGSIQSARGGRFFRSTAATCRINMASDDHKLKLVILYLHTNTFANIMALLQSINRSINQSEIFNVARMAVISILMIVLHLCVINDDDSHFEVHVNIVSNVR